MRSSWSLSVLLIVFGGLAVSGIGGHRPLGVLQWTLAAMLVVAGVLLFTRTRASLYFAFAAGAATTVTGILAFAHHPELALPVWPALSVGMGLYIILRAAMAAPTLGGAKKKGFIP